MQPTGSSHGDDGGQPLAELVPLVYDELRRLARGYLGRERPGQTLQPTALVNEAYLRLARDRKQEWGSRARVVGIAAMSMRQILIERARARDAQKRGGGRARVTLDEGLLAGRAQRSSGWPASTRGRPDWSSCGSSAGSPSRSAPRCSASRPPR